MIKNLAGETPFQKGERKLGTSAKIGYFSQHRADTLDPDLSILGELKRRVTVAGFKVAAS